MKRNGFTVIELAIVIAIMSILLVLGMSNFNESQTSARDVERKTDVEAIVLHLDNFYDSGYDSSTSVGKYPSTAFITTIANVKTYLRNIDEKSLTAPLVDNPMVTWKAATSNSVQNPTIDEYIYQPLKSDGTLCTIETDECRKFKIYYRLESDDLVYVATGKNQ